MTHQTPAEMREEFMRSDASKQEFCGNEDHECQCDVNRDKIADFWLSKLQAREEWLKEEIEKLYVHDISNPIVTALAPDGLVSKSHVLSLITKK